VATIFDLFGDPVPENHGRRGRPQHIPTAENRNKVSMMLAWGWSNERIAGVLRCTLPTLRKHYFSELKFREVARDRLTMEQAAMLWAQGKDGNVAAMREFDRLMERNDRMGAEAAMAAVPADQPAAGKIGKKVVDQQRAMDADADLTAELELEAAAGQESDAARH
jgi:hypothetical protein